MKIFDMHIHANATVPDPQALIAKMEKAGIYGGCVFSNRPDCSSPTGTSFDERVKEALAWCKGYEERLFPVVWISPYEENIIENLHKAVEAGIAAFKIICTEYYIYEEQCLRVLREIAALNRPVFFHSGILWYDKPASAYNRPLNWEALVNIENLRFSMAHCAWPWVDELLAMYGEFFYMNKYQHAAEMFLDLTPGTPPIYRKELLTKLYTIGYDVGDNVLYGTDSTADVYDEDFVRPILERDRRILDDLGVSGQNREKLYYQNILRFLGKTEAKVEQMVPEADKEPLWRCDDPEVYRVIWKNYQWLNFPKEHDEAFRQIVSEIRIPDTISIEDYAADKREGEKNLLAYLYMCEALKGAYAQKHIPEQILYDTLQDIVVWTNTWTDLKGRLFLGETDWLSNHLRMKLFRLGRLQFCMGNAKYDIAEKGIQKGDPVIEVHIPEGEALDIERCKEAFAQAEAFFAEFYPEFKYAYFVCDSWLMDDTLRELLCEESNILRFSAFFEKYYPKKDDAILRYVFSWNTARYNLKKAAVTSELAKKVKQHILSGKDFYSAYGVMKKGEYKC